MHVLWMTLVPFLFVPTPLGRVVFINGVLTHATEYRWIERWDIACNLVMGVWIGATCQHRYYLLLLMALIGWRCNRNRNPVVHAFGVQLPLLVVAWYYP